MAKPIDVAAIRRRRAQAAALGRTGTAIGTTAPTATIAPPPAPKPTVRPTPSGPSTFVDVGGRKFQVPKSEAARAPSAPTAPTGFAPATIGTQVFQTGAPTPPTPTQAPPTAPTVTAPPPTAPTQIPTAPTAPTGQVAPFGLNPRTGEPLTISQAFAFARQSEPGLSFPDFESRFAQPGGAPMGFTPITPPPTDAIGAVAPEVAPTGAAGGNLEAILAAIGGGVGADAGAAASLSPIQQALITALQPSQEEVSLEEQIAGQTAAERQGLFDIEQQPIALPFITGQQRAVQEQAGITRANLLDQLGLFQQERGIQGQVAEALLGFQAGRETREQQEFANRISLATKGLRYDPATDSFSIDPNLSEPDTKEILDIEEGLRKEFVKDAGDFIKIRDSFGRIQASAQDPSAAGDLALIFNFMKMLDPGSVVRESEFANAANSAGVPERIRNLWNRMLTGTRLGDLEEGEQREDFVKRANLLFQTQLTQHEQRIGVFENLATGAGVNPDNVTIDLGLASGLGDTAAITGQEQTDIDLLKAQLKPGKILITRNGQLGALPIEEFDPETDERL